MKAIAVSSLASGVFTALALLLVVKSSVLDVRIPASLSTLPRPAGTFIRSDDLLFSMPTPSARVSATPVDSAGFIPWAERDPAAAGAWLRSHPAYAERSQALAAVISRWLRIDPRSAANFALSLPEPPARAQALEIIATNWAAADPAALSRWAESLPPSPELDSVAAAIATLPALAAADAEKAIGWADTILNPELREQSFAFIIAATETPDGKG